MCGILGVLGNTAPFSESAFKDALDTLAHRGPDASATWFGESAMLGHRRLAILDLSDAGIQPMRDDASGLIIVFNGEIYNYLELRTALESRGHRFKTETDTEVLLKGYAEWGPAVQERCNGMWAFVIWDPGTRQAFFSRDRFGVKPFYFVDRGDQLLFASEPKALHRLDASLTEPDSSTLVELVVNSRIHIGSRTAYRSIKALPAAHSGSFDVGSGSLTQSRYWDYPEMEPGARQTGEYEEFAEIFADAVRVRLRSDVEVGLTLSGGLDSSAVLAASTALQPRPLKCFTSVYPGETGGELNWAEAAAQCAGATLTPVGSDLETWWDTLQDVVHHMDAPGFSPAVLPLWSIMAEARASNVPVLLEGQGADEFLAGYHWHSAVNALAHLRKLQLGDFAGDLWQIRKIYGLKWGAAWMARTAFSDVYTKWIRDRRFNLFHAHAVDDWRDGSFEDGVTNMDASHDPLRQRLIRDHAIDLLPSLLHYGDAISMAHGIESRLPFMDYRLVEWVFRNPVELIKDGRTKEPVRAYLMAENFDVIAARPDKVGYNTPINTWYSRYCNHLIRDLIANKSEPIWDYMVHEQVAKLADRLEHRNSQQFYKILTANFWLRQLKTRSSGGQGQVSGRRDFAAA